MLTATSEVVVAVRLKSVNAVKVLKSDEDGHGHGSRMWMATQFTTVKRNAANELQF